MMGPLVPILKEDTVQVWRASLDCNKELSDWLASNLIHEELTQAKSIGNPVTRRRFVARRAILRLLLKPMIGCDPRDIEFALSTYGKPTIRDSTLQFSVSSSCDEALFAVSTTRPVGVDIERIVPGFQYKTLLTEHFTPSECAQLTSNAASGLTHFFQYWTWKEACAKAVGTGLTRGLATYEVTHGIEDWTELPSGLVVRNLSVAVGFAAAVACWR